MAAVEVTVAKQSSVREDTGEELERAGDGPLLRLARLLAHQAARQWIGSVAPDELSIDVRTAADRPASSPLSQ